MDRAEWINKRDNRTLRYAGRRFDPAQWITVDGDPAFFSSYEGQAAALTACNLLSRMSPSVALSIPDVAVVAPLPWAGKRLVQVILDQMRSADPGGTFQVRPAVASDVVVFLGRQGATHLAHGAGWNTYLGPAPSPIPDCDPNPFGASFAAILAVSQLFVHDLNPTPLTFLCNALNWQEALAPSGSRPPGLSDLGQVWTPGAGSVGTASLYFLTLWTRDFSAAIFDMDIVKIENLDRSPIFSADDAKVGRKKAESTGRYLQSVGVKDIIIEARALHDSDVWMKRVGGRPDAVISAANEFNVRSVIELTYPPVQVYATTGVDWQVTLVRHIPLKDFCSTCLFPSDTPSPAMKCATGDIPATQIAEQQVDAALPFLSFAAGLMTAAELTKLQLPGYPFSTNLVHLFTRPSPMLTPVMGSSRRGCLCSSRSRTVHTAMLHRTRYEALSFAA